MILPPPELIELDSWEQRRSWPEIFTERACLMAGRFAIWSARFFGAKAPQNNPRIDVNPRNDPNEVPRTAWNVDDSRLN
jgi:hypothetical protein